MTIAPIAAGYFIAYLKADDGQDVDYYRLRVVTVVATSDGGIEPIVMTPDGKTLRADELPGRAFSVAPGECFKKLAAVHAAQLGRNLRVAA